MERSSREIIFDTKTDKISSVPSISPDVDYGDDTSEKPINPIFFDENNGDMPIDSVNGKVVTQ